MLESLNFYGKNKIPVIFIIDFDKCKSIILPVTEIDKNEILYDLNGFKNYNDDKVIDKKIILRKYPIDFAGYKRKFDEIIKHLKYGNSFLVNLTQPTKIEINLSLREIFHISKAKYKLLYKDNFLFFSPETFITISDNTISTFPMKGTINAEIPNAEAILLADEKELAEHITVVDLLRNDLGIVAKNIKMEKFRYIDKIVTEKYTLLQVSSIITGLLNSNWHEKTGDILNQLLPAGSVTGAPKIKTVEIIKEVERYVRGYYTGICGYFTGERLDACVMIRFIEKHNGEMFFKSGGGITIYSDAESEYKELVDKVYVPIA